MLSQNPIFPPTDARIVECGAIFEEILTHDCHLRVRVTGKSMTPFLCGGSVVTLESVPGNDLRRGDIIFFKTHQSRFLLHRVIKKNRTPDGSLWIQTKGDAIKEADAPVISDQVLGRVRRIERKKDDGRTLCIDLSAGIWPFISPILPWLFRVRTMLGSIRPKLQA